MTAHLSLVVDNTTQQKAPSPSSAKSSTSWVHAGWRWHPSQRAGVRCVRPVNDTEPAPQHAPVTRRRDRLRAILTNDRGAVTAEYAIVIMAGVAFAGLLVAIMRSSEIRQMLVDLVQSALGSAG